MSFVQSRKTPVEAYGTRSIKAQRHVLGREQCTCRGRRTVGIAASPVAENSEDDDDVHSLQSARGTERRTGYCAQCAVVYSELRQVESTVRHAPSARDSAARAARTVGTGDASVFGNDQLMGAPFHDVAVTAGRGATTAPVQSSPLAEASFLSAVFRIQQAAEWLSACPVTTLRQLQQHTLCQLERYVTTYVGMPDYMQALMVRGANGEAGEKDSSTALMDDAGVDAPLPLDLRSFLADFLVAPAPTTASHTARHLLSAGRPLPAAPVTGVDLPYGTFLVEEALRTSEAAVAATSATTALDNQLLAEAGEWTRFFNRFWDPAREAQCRDPLSLFTAILLACGTAGQRERAGRLDAIIEREVTRCCRADDSVAHARTCRACQATQDRIREAVTWRCLSTTAASSGAALRFFLSTPAVALWLAGFLQLRRMTFGTHSHPAGLGRTVSIEQDEQDCEREAQTHSGVLDADVVPPGEAYAMRDWLLQAVSQDARGFDDQETASTLCTTATSASAAPVQRTCFREAALRTSIAKLSAWMDANVQRGRPLRARVILHVLREEFPVTAYYYSFFLPRRSCS